MSLAELHPSDTASTSDRQRLDRLVARVQAGADLADAVLAIGVDDPTWLDDLAAALDARRDVAPLQRVMSVWGLTQSDIGEVMGVSRQAVSKWLVTGVPAERTDSVADLAAATDILVRYLKRDRIPAVVRRPAPALSDRSLLQIVAAGDTAGALVACRAMFDVAAVHV
jgi:hypothetical protein